MATFENCSEVLRKRKFQTSYLNVERCKLIAKSKVNIEKGHDGIHTKMKKVICERQYNPPNKYIRWITSELSTDMSHVSNIKQILFRAI